MSINDRPENESTATHARAAGSMRPLIPVFIALAVIMAVYAGTVLDGYSIAPRASQDLMQADGDYHVAVARVVNRWRESTKQVNELKQAAAEGRDLSAFESGLVTEAVADEAALRDLAEVVPPVHHRETHDRLVDDLRRLMECFAQLNELYMRADWYRAAPVVDEVGALASDLSAVLNEQRAEDREAGIHDRPDVDVSTLSVESVKANEVGAEGTANSGGSQTSGQDIAPAEQATNAGSVGSSLVPDGEVIRKAWPQSELELTFEDGEEALLRIAKKYGDYWEGSGTAEGADLSGEHIDGLIYAFTVKAKGSSPFVVITAGKLPSGPTTLVSFDNRWYVKQVYENVKTRKEIDGLLDRMEGSGNESYQRGGAAKYDSFDTQGYQYASDPKFESVPWQPPNER